MRRISDFQINSPRLDSVIDEVTEARGDYDSLAERLDDLKLGDYKIVSAEPAGDSLLVTVNPGLAFIDETPILSHTQLSVAIYQPEPQMVYYIYLHKNGELLFSIEKISDGETLLLGTVETGETVTDVSIVDLRPILQKGGITGEIIEARGEYDTLGQRLDAIGDVIDSSLIPITGRLESLEEEVTTARDDYPTLDERLDALDTLINNYSFTEEYIATEGQQVFTLKHPYPVGQKKLRVYVNGVLYFGGLDGEGDYTETDKYTVTFNTPLPKDTRVVFTVENILPYMGFTETFQAQEGQTQFTLTYPYPVGQKKLRVYVNGLLNWPGEDSDYRETDEYTICFNTPLEEGDLITFILETVNADDIRSAGGYPSIVERLNSQLGDCNVDIAIEYDEHKRIIKETWSGDVNKTVEYQYDEYGRRAVKTVTEGNLIITASYTYNEVGLVSHISVRKEIAE